MFNHTGGLLLQTVLYLVNTNTTTYEEGVFNTLEQVKRGEDMEVRCFGELGCYSINYPWTDESRPVSHYPEPPEKVAPGYCLYTRSNPTECQLLFHNDSASVHGSHLVPTHRLFFIAHGFLDSGHKPWIKLLALKLLRRMDCNVIAIDWHRGSSPPYTQAVANIRLVGTITAHLINTLHKEVGVKTEYVHVIGHSLGAHLAGYVGNTLATKFGLTLGRITGLDPAEPHFSETQPEVRLDPTDAIFVDIIHTDATPFIQGGLGMDEPIGHVDFYPNGGENQPGCDQSVKEIMDKGDGSFVKALQRFLGCDHVRSSQYFIESIGSTCKFMAIECDSWDSFIKGNCFKCKNEINEAGQVCAKMGYNSIRYVQKDGAELGDIHPASGRSLVKLFTITNSRSPYCVSLYRITLTISNSRESKEHLGEVGIFRVRLDGVEGKTEDIHLFKEQYWMPGSSQRMVVGARQVGRVRAATLFWDHSTTFNLLTWRLTRARIHFANLTVDNLEEDSSTTLCPVKDEVIFSGQPVELRPCGGGQPRSLSLSQPL